MSEITPNEEAAYARGFAAGQKSMREVAAGVCQNRTLAATLLADNSNDFQTQRAHLYAKCEANACRDEILQALITAPPADDGWQPIATAPKDGEFIIANNLGQVCSCTARKGQRQVNNSPLFSEWTYGSEITHWRPLPPPPVGGV